MRQAQDFREDIRRWGRELGFDAIGFTRADDADAIADVEGELAAWLAAGYHGEMDYMARHGSKRTRPGELVPGTRTVITARMNYLPPDTAPAATLQAPERAYVARYALGRDYHTLLRRRLQQLADRMTQELAGRAGEFSCRAFTDSAPVMEVHLARQSGLGWRGKHTLLLERKAGSFFFLGEIHTSLELPPDAPVTDHCGTCTACIDSCPTAAIRAPYQLDARRCIAYLTIELRGPIPAELRPQLGNRIYGCDDCQLCCPWNREAPITRETDFTPRQRLDEASLIELFAWSEEEFDSRLAGSAIRRIGFERWLRNIAVALGNAPSSDAVIAALRRHADHPSALVREHVGWALAQHAARRPASQ